MYGSRLVPVKMNHRVTHPNRVTLLLRDTHAEQLLGQPEITPQLDAGRYGQTVWGDMCNVKT